MNDRALAPSYDSAEGRQRLRDQLQDVRRELLEAEARLAQEQAAVNAFRLHCRLKLDSWIDTLLSLQTRRQALLTRLELLRQAREVGLSSDEADAFWQSETDEAEPGAGEPELLLPTDTPRDKMAERRLYRRLARKFHPDLGQTALEVAYRTEMMATVNAAYQNGDGQALYDLVGELDPGELAELAAIETAETRRLRQELLHLARRKRRTERRLSELRRENTARLWQKARTLERDDVHWWEVVRREIEQASDRLRADVTRLEERLRSLEAAPDGAPGTAHDARPRP
jgi:hypothetical protein